MKKNRLKLAFGFFIGLVTLCLTAGIYFLESTYFGNFVKKAMIERAPKTLGISGDFSNIKLYFFPPGIGFANPKVQIQKENISKLFTLCFLLSFNSRFHFFLYIDLIRR